MIFEGTLLWLVVVVALAFWLPQNAQHEGMHALVVRRNGGTITRFTPYPNWKNGHFTWASVAWEGGEYTREGRAAISIAPQVANTVVLLMLIGVRAALAPHPILDSILAGMAITQFMDGAWNLGTFYRPEPEEHRKHTDGWSFQRLLDLPVLPCRIGAAVWHLGFGSALFLPLGL